MIEITLTGRMGKEEVDVQFDEATREVVGVSVQQNSLIPDEYKAWYDRTWSADLNGYDEVTWNLSGCRQHPDKPDIICRWLRSHGFQANQQEEDWLEHATNTIP